MTDFEVIRGQLSVSWRNIPPNGNVTHVVVLKPLKSGVFNFTAASLTYQPAEDAESQVFSYRYGFGLFFMLVFRW